MGLTETAPDELVFAIEADGFLRGMVRNIVGTLVEVGKGKRPTTDVERILRSRDRRNAGHHRPAAGAVFSGGALLTAPIAAVRQPAALRASTRSL